MSIRPGGNGAVEGRGKAASPKPAADPWSRCVRVRSNRPRTLTLVGAGAIVSCMHAENVLTVAVGRRPLFFFSHLQKQRPVLATIVRQALWKGREFFTNDWFFELA